MSPSPPSSPPKGSRPAKSVVSVTANASPKKDHRGKKRLSPLQISAVGNRVVTDARVQDKKNTSGIDCQAESISHLESDAPELAIPSPKRHKAFHTDTSKVHYSHQSFQFASLGENVGSSTKYRKNQRCEAILGSGVIFPQSVCTPSQLDGRKGDERSQCRDDPYIVDSARSLGDSELGMFARTHIPQGATILTEFPVIVVPRDIKEIVGSVAGLDETKSQEELIDTLVFRLDSQQEVFAMKDCLGLPNVTTPSGIFSTNAFDIELKVNATSPKSAKHMYKALFLQTSRCNHSCGPNAVWKFDSSTFALILVAVRAIRPGEEITISYINPFLPRHLRRVQLQSKWKFTCHCTHCDIPWSFPGAIAQSDRARHELSTFFKKLPDWEQWCFDEKNEMDLIGMHLRAMQLREEEGLEGFKDGGAAGHWTDVAYMKHIDALVMCFGALADVQGFRKWVNKAREVKLAEGPNSVSHVKVLDSWLKEPKKFYVWGWKA
ncbi:hypothetical protein C8R42DRAFT_729437 [Lentinula raphanica]|nr:hypothetical protein C8R42DRAFT_729437 [Lentinula raphanica]